MPGRAGTGNRDFRRVWRRRGEKGAMSDGGDRAHADEGRLVTGQAAAVTDQLRGVAAFTITQVEAAHGYAGVSRTASTRAKCLRHSTAFDSWCRGQGCPSLPAVVVIHLSSLAAADMALRTLALRMAAIGHGRRQASEAIPHKVRDGTVVLDVLAGARRTWGKSRRTARRPPAATRCCRHGVLPEQRRSSGRGMAPSIILMGTSHLLVLPTALSSGTGASATSPRRCWRTWGTVWR